MSLSFDGVDDAVTLASQTLGTSVSVAAWFKATSQGEGNSGTICNHIGGGGQLGRFDLRFNASAGSKKLRIDRNSATDGIWDMTSGFGSITQWLFAGLTFDVSSASNDPILYTLDGSTFSTLTVGSGLTETATPVGAVDADGTDFLVSNDSVGDRTFDGLIGEVALWTRLLTAAEMAAVATLGAMAVPGMYLYWPMDNTGSAQATDFSGNARNGTISGAVVGENPPMRPAGRRG